MKGLLTTPSLREQRAAAAETHQSTKKTSIGCMPSIFFFFQRHHHSHSRKRIASGKKDKAAEPPPPPPKQQQQQPVTSKELKKVALKRAGSSDVVRPSRSDYSRLTCDVPRSPTIPAEIRRPTSASNSAAPLPESPKKPPALVARLMGLDEIPVTSPDSMAEKRRKLLGALEKCDEDLKALKHIIDAVRLDESRKLPEVRRVGLRKSEMLSAGDCEVVEKRMCPEQQHKPRINAASVFNNGERSDRTQTPIQRSMKGDRGEEAKRRREEDKGAASTGCGGRAGCAFFRLQEGLPRGRGRRGAAAVRALVRKAAGRWRTMRSSKAMAESVDEVWEDGIREERWEYGRVGVALEGDIFGDLVEEVVGEMGSAGRRRTGDAAEAGARGCYSSLPFDACRRRLRF